MAPQSCAYIVSNLRVVHGSPLGFKPHPDIEERLVNKKKGFMVET
jgi:hypothetical protein